MRILKTDDATAGLQAMYLLQIFAQAQQHQNDFQLTTLLEHLGCDTPAEASVTIKDYFYKHIRRVCRCEYDRCLRWKKTALPKGVSGRGRESTLQGPQNALQHFVSHFSNYFYIIF